MSSKVVVELLEANEWQRLRSIRLEALTESEHAFGGTLEAESVEDENSWRKKFEKLDFLIASVDGVDAAMLIGGSSQWRFRSNLLDWWLLEQSKFSWKRFNASDVYLY
jgi:hypothetical protein